MSRNPKFGKIAPSNRYRTRHNPLKASFLRAGMGVGPDRSDCAGAPGDRWQRGAGGSVMTCSLLIAGHDPALHSDPHRFDIERADTTHLAIGGSMHYCLGAPLAAPRHRSPSRRCSSVSTHSRSTRSMPSSTSAHRSSTDWKRFGCAPPDKRIAFVRDEFDLPA